MTTAEKNQTTAVGGNSADEGSFETVEQENKEKEKDVKEEDKSEKQTKAETWSSSSFISSASPEDLLRFVSGQSSLASTDYR